MSPARVPCSPQPRNTPSIAAAVIMTGTTIGAMTRLAINPAPGIRARARPTAAAVPAAVATVALGHMMIALVAVGSRQIEELGSLRLHWQEKASRGKARNAAEVEDTNTP